jgi:hypothetical protein
MTSFANSWEHQELLKIAKEHLDSLDRSRIRSDAVIGFDNVAKLKVSTVFAAIAVEAALNDFVLIHDSLLRQPHLQRGLRAFVHKKIEWVCDHWPDKFPDMLLQDVHKLFKIRNRIVHQTKEYLTANDTTNEKAVVRNRPLTNDDMQHMLRHYDIACDFLSRFWLPGSRELGGPCHGKATAATALEQGDTTDVGREGERNP